MTAQLRMAPPRPGRVAAHESVCGLRGPVPALQVLVTCSTTTPRSTRPTGPCLVAAGREGDVAIVRLRTTGVGIPPEMLAASSTYIQPDHLGNGPCQGGAWDRLTLVRGWSNCTSGSITAASPASALGTIFCRPGPRGGPQCAPRRRRGGRARPVRRHILNRRGQPDGRETCQCCWACWAPRGRGRDGPPRGRGPALGGPDGGRPELDNRAAGAWTATMSPRGCGPGWAGACCSSPYGLSSPRTRERAAAAGFDAPRQPVEPEAVAERLLAGRIPSS